jgi:hypothetical protein
MQYLDNLESEKERDYYSTNLSSILNISSYAVIETSSEMLNSSSEHEKF